jgi:hypothetical protein
MSKNELETRGHKWRHNMANTRCMLGKQGYTLARACSCPRTHTDKYLILIAFTRQQCLRERASMLRYTYIICLITVLLRHSAPMQSELLFISAFLNSVPLLFVKLNHYIINYHCDLCSSHYHHACHRFNYCYQSIVTVSSLFKTTLPFFVVASRIYVSPVTVFELRTATRGEYILMVAGKTLASKNCA